MLSNGRLSLTTLCPRSNLNKMRTKLQLDQDILEAAKALAETKNKSLGKVVSDLARKGLGSQESKVGTITDSPPFPVFDLPPDAPPLTPELVRRALEDTG